MHFGQAETEKIPFTTAPLEQQFNWSASTHFAELVFEGKMAQLLLKNLRRVSELDSIPPLFVTIDELNGKFQKWWEATTSTSPSGRHLGHYKEIFCQIDRSIPD